MKPLQGEVAALAGRRREASGRAAEGHDQGQDAQRRVVARRLHPEPVSARPRNPGGCPTATGHLCRDPARPGGRRRAGHVGEGAPQDAIAVRALLHDLPANDAELSPAYPKVERRHAPRSAAQRHDESRIAARAIEFACIGLVALMFGMTVFGTVQQALAQPIAQVSAALDGR